MTEKVAVVTGANKGLGFVLVKGLCEKFNGTVYLTSRDEERGKHACKLQENLGLKPSYHQLDITNEESIAKFCAYIRKKHGKVDLLINNAGILFLKDAKEPKIYQSQQTIQVNFFSLVNFTEAMLPLMKNGGKIVNITSSSGHLSRIPSNEIKREISSPDITLESLKRLLNKYLEDVQNDNEIESGWGESPYVVSKVGVNAYTFLLNRKLSDRDIKVNCVHPGYIMSDMTRGSGTITLEQGSKVPLWLALEAEKGGLYLWHDGTIVPWDGPDPRGFIDGKNRST